MPKTIAAALDFVLPVDGPDAEQAAASTMANAVSLTKKTQPESPFQSR